MNIQRLFQFLFLSLYCLVIPVGVSAETTVRIAFNGFGGVAPLYLGQEAGIFKKQGLNLDTRRR
jgi:ABC-type nitrate/sulfonate/bicarbonate transport system substrate-binding protein